MGRLFTYFLSIPASSGTPRGLLLLLLLLLLLGGGGGLSYICILGGLHMTYTKRITQWAGEG